MERMASDNAALRKQVQVIEKQKSDLEQEYN